MCNGLIGEAGGNDLHSFFAIQLAVITFATGGLCTKLPQTSFGNVPVFICGTFDRQVVGQW